MKITADLCLIPVNQASVTPHIATCQRIFKRRRLLHHLHGYGTNLEGDWEQVMEAIKECHQEVHASGVVRIVSTIKVGTRTDREQSNADKIRNVNRFIEDSPV